MIKSKQYKFKTIIYKSKETNFGSLFGSGKKVEKMKKIASSVSAAVLVFLFAALLCVSSSAASALKAPTGLKASSKADSVSLTWKKVRGADGYKIYVFENGKAKSFGYSAKSAFQKSKLQSEGEYILAVRAYTKTDGKKSFGPYSEKITVKTKLETPSNVKASKATVSSFKISWSAVPGAEKYQIYMSPTGVTSYKLVGTTEKTNFTLKNLDGKTGYKIRLRAVKKGNSSEKTKIFVFYALPSPVKNVKTKTISGSAVKLTWEASSPATAYRIYASEGKNGKLRFLEQTKEKSFTFSKGKSETNYYFKIRPIIENDRQKIKGVSCSPVRGKTGRMIISLSRDTVRRGEYIDVSATGAKSALKLSSSDKSVIKIEDGRLHAVGTGKAVITAKSGKSSAKLSVRVNDAIFNYMSCVFDVSENEMIFSNRINDRCYPASITKLITALVAVKNMSLNSTIVVGDELNMVEPLSSRCGIERGEKFRLGDLLYGLLLPSGGDAAYTIAVNCARKVSGNSSMGYVAAKNYFVGMMNDYMKSIGATGTHCVNPHGYPVSGHYSTVHDLLLVAKKVLKDPTLSKITSTQGHYVTALTGKGRYWTTTNGLITPWSASYCKYSHGMKTGTVNDNYTGIISAATNDKHTVITIVIGCESYAARYNATHKLYNYYFY